VSATVEAFHGMSRDICNECLFKPATELRIFEKELSSGNPDPFLKNWYTWIDGKYVHWETFRHLRSKAS